MIRPKTLSELESLVKVRGAMIPLSASPGNAIRVSLRSVREIWAKCEEASLSLVLHDQGPGRYVLHVEENS